MLLSPENALPRKISGAEVKCKDLSRYMRAYVDIFKGDEMPEPKSMLEATSEANNLASLSEAKDTYIAMMESVCGGDKPYINERVLDIEHCKMRDQSMEVFGSRRKMGGEEGSAKYREQLEGELDELYGHYRAHNESKNIFKAANTPITLGAVAMLLYVLSQLFSLVGLLALANIINLVMLCTFVLLATWGYSKYSGNLAEVGAAVDALATKIWDSGLQPTFNKIAEEGTQFAARKAAQRLKSTTTT